MYVHILKYTYIMYMLNKRYSGEEYFNNKVDKITHSWLSLNLSLATPVINKWIHEQSSSYACAQ
jgi:hypothetical protein